jgi:hypothetical protein
MTHDRAAALATWRDAIDRLARRSRSVAFAVFVTCPPDPCVRAAVSADPEALVAAVIAGSRRPPHWSPAALVKTWTLPVALTPRVLGLPWDELLSAAEVLAAGVALPAAVAWTIRRDGHEYDRQRGRRPNRRARRAGRRRDETP